MKTQPSSITSAILFIMIFALAACSADEQKSQTSSYCLRDSEVMSEQHEIEPVGSASIKIPAIPEPGDADVSEELDHIFFTDQADRLNGAFLTDTSRDSARLARVNFLYSKGLIDHWEDKYKAAFVFIHAGGPFADINSENYYKASKLFFEVSEECTDPQLADESKKLGETALNRYVNSRVFESIIQDPNLKKNGNPFISISLEQS